MSDDDPLMKNDLENRGREYSDMRGQLIFNMYLIVLNNFNARIGRKRPLPADPKQRDEQWVGKCIIIVRRRV